MTRRALIIAAPGPTTNFLGGVKYDLHNYQNFLLSPSGGGWQPEEVQWMQNPSKLELLNYLKNMHADYTLVVFSGHGAMDKTTGRSFVEINTNGERFWVDNLGTPAAQQLTILDSCRDYVSTLAGIVNEGVQLFPSSLTVPQARDLFDSQLALCEPGWITCYACEPGQSASDTLGGGLFSNVLFQIAQDWVNEPSPESVLSIYTALHNARQIMTASSKQTPALRQSSISRQSWFPFAVRQSLQVV